MERHKARLVAKGFSQQPGIDFEETFAPVARQSSIRMVMALSAELGLCLYQLDVVMAYTNGDLDEEIFMEQADGFIKEGNEHLVYSLKKSIYGLKQPGRQWFKKLDQRLKSLGLKQLNSDNCVYMRKTDDTFLILIIYVDDLIVAADSVETFTKLKEALAKEFEMKYLGKLHYCLGIEFQQDPISKSIFMCQKKYIDDVLSKFGMQVAKPMVTPLDGNVKLTKEMEPSTEEESQEMKGVPYQSLIGSLMYLAVSTRPDIAYAVSALSQYNRNPGKTHWSAAKRVLRYLKGIRNHGLMFHKTGEDLVGFVDADWGSNADDRRSYTGFIFRIAGAAVTWEARKQRTVALSSAEAEYIALSDAAKETVYLRSFLSELGCLNPNSKSTVVYCDNQGAQKLMRNPVHHARTKHVDIRHHYVREVFERGELNVEYISTNEMIADILTKGLFGPNHRKCLKGLGAGDL